MEIAVNVGQAKNGLLPYTRRIRKDVKITTPEKGHKDIALPFHVTGRKRGAREKRRELGNFIHFKGKSRQNLSRAKETLAKTSKGHRKSNTTDRKNGKSLTNGT